VRGAALGRCPNRLIGVITSRRRVRVRSQPAGAAAVKYPNLWVREVDSRPGLSLDSLAKLSSMVMARPRISGH